MTPRPSHCQNYCEEEGVPASELKCCAACKKVWYCSKECQKQHWRFHVFDCKLIRPIGTAYYLSRACREDLVPVHVQTRKDFGFDKAEKILGGGALSNVLGLWIGVFYSGVSEKEVQKWQAEGRLVDEIKSIFERIPPHARGSYYSWFLQHQTILDGSSVNTAQVRETEERTRADAISRAWVKTGGSVNDNAETIGAQVNALPTHVQACHVLYRIMTLGAHPGPDVELWVNFGFVFARNQWEEMELARRYLDLIERCTFAEFSTAYQASSIPKLADAHGVSMPIASFSVYLNDGPGSPAKLFQDIMSESPRRVKSVWYLKQYVDLLLCSVPSAPPPLPHKAVDADYGFMNCKTISETKLLDELYTKYFAHSDANPLDLHKACVRGELAQYINGIVKLKPKTGTYKRLLKNAYPLPMLGEWQGLATFEAVQMVIRG